MDENKEINFETALRELDLVVEQLEGQELTLEEALSLFERGRKLLDYCQQKLVDAELRLVQLSTEEM